MSDNKRFKAVKLDPKDHEDVEKAAKGTKRAIGFLIVMGTTGVWLKKVGAKSISDGLKSVVRMFKS